MEDCACKIGDRPMNTKTMNSCELQVQKLVKGRLLGRSSGGCKDSPGTWEPCVPRNVEFSIDQHTFDALNPDTQVNVEYRNGTNEMIALLDVVIDQAATFDPGPPAVLNDVSDLLVVNEILGAQTGDESYGTFAGRGSNVRDLTNNDVGQIGRLAAGVPLSQLNAERAAAFGGSPNYGSIFSKIKLPIIAPQQSFSFRIGLSPLVTGALADVQIAGSILAVQFSKSAYDRIYG